MEAICLRKKLLRDGRVLALARTVKRSRLAILGALFVLWSLADELVGGDGLLQGYTPADVDCEVEILGFCAALPPDWCKIEGEAVYLPNYGAVPLMLALPAHDRAKRARRAAPLHPEMEIPAIPKTLDTPEFRAAWAEWQAYKRELKKPLTASTVKHQFRELTALRSVHHAVASIHQSIARSWQGLFPVNGFLLPAEVEEMPLERYARIVREREEALKRGHNGPVLSIQEAAARLRERRSRTDVDGGDDRRSSATAQ
jgi:hypothetical protein